ncbi:MAG: phosphoenolpyruvate synthase [SAR324 cluster bacterium]|nr:phosphoenolpyruvate synthase [SAR324 cluster bacterium]MCZ6647105.1 phosphoenolpyruvate synthase [SAR324 cluster bacterium]
MAEKGEQQFIHWFKDLGIKDVPLVGGKNASLGEMFANLTGKGVMVPDGFAISAYAYVYYTENTGIHSQIHELLDGLDARDVVKLAATGEKVRTLMRATPLPKDLEQAITDAYDDLCKMYGGEVDTAVRSSATAEDLPDASFAGQQDTYLNVRGHGHLLEASRNCFASLFTDRAIAYRQEQKYDHFSVALSIAVQKMVRSDLASAGVMFSIDTESGFKDAIYITGGYGLGENVVQGAINPDEFYVHKPTLKAGYKPIIHSHLGEKQQKMIYVDPSKGKGTENVPVPQEEREQFCLNNDEVLLLAKWAAIIEDHYSEEAGYYKPMDMEWAKDGESGDMFIVQARPETVVSRREEGVLRRMVLEKTGPVISEGMAVGDSIGAGPANVILSTANIENFKEGEVLVTEITDPDWVPIMKIAAAIVTDSGGRTSHAAIISRELGIPCIVGTGDGSKKIQPGEEITVSCAGGSKGTVYKGRLPFSEETIRLDQLEMPSIGMMFHQSVPDRAFPDSRYPNAGVGLARVDELMRNEVKVHPLAALAYAKWKEGSNEALAGQIDEVSRGYADKAEYFVTRLAQCIAIIAASSYPKPARVLLSDGSSKDLDRLIGGKEFVFDGDNPFMGVRGAVRYMDLDYEEAFQLELKALARVHGEMGLTNLAIVVPGAQTPREAGNIIDLLAGSGLKRGENGLEYHLLVRTPAQVLTLEAFGEDFDGFLFDVGDLAQLALGIDRNNPLAREFYSEKHPAVLELLQIGLQQAKKLKKPVGLANISPGNLKDIAASPAFGEVAYVVVRPDVFPKAREEFLETEQG